MSVPQVFRKKSAVGWLGALLLLASTMLLAAAGDVDPSFVNANITGIVIDSALQPDGTIVIGGRFTSVGGASRIILARLNDDGTNDPTFTSPFLEDFNNQVLSLAVQTDGSILVGGLLLTPSGFKPLVRVTASGLLDPTFSAPAFFGQVSQVFYRAADSKIFTANQNSGVSLLNLDGSFVEQIGPFLQQVRAFVVQPDGMVVIGGSANGFSTVLRFFPNNDVDPDDVDHTFNGGNLMGVAPEGSIADMELLPNGQILVSGAFSSIDGVTTRHHIARLQTTGVVDDSFSTPVLPFGPGIVDMAVQADGRIVVGGYFQLPGDVSGRGFARLNADGSVDTSFPVDPPDRNTNLQIVRSINVQPDGRILIAGDFASIALIARTAIARLFADGTNTAPVLSNTAVTSPINENGTVTLSGNISDVDAADTFALTVDWGEGLAPQGFNYPAGTTSFSVQHQYLDDNPTATSSDGYPINLTLADSGGGSDTSATSVTVNNLAPSLSGTAASPATITVGGSTTASGNIADTGTLDSQTVTIAWGDGTASTTLNLAAGVLTFSSTHQYNVAGTFTIGITASDDDGGVTNGNASVTVNPVVVTPNAPSNLTASAVSKTQINLAWIDNSSNESGFKIERCTAKGKNCTYAEIAQTSANATSFSNTGLMGNTEYRYRIRAFTGSSNSAYANIAIARTPKK